MTSVYCLTVCVHLLLLLVTYADDFENLVLLAVVVDAAFEDDSMDFFTSYVQLVRPECLLSVLYSVTVRLLALSWVTRARTSPN